MGGEPPNPRDLGRPFALAQVGLEMVAPIVLGLILDSKLDWSPWGVVVGAVVGLVGGLAHLIVQANRLDKKEPPSRQDSR